MYLRKEKGGTAIGPYEWPEDGSVAEVDELTGRSLLAIPDHDFTKVDGPDPDPEISEGPAQEPSAEITEDGGSPDGGDDSTSAEASTKTRRSRRQPA